MVYEISYDLNRPGQDYKDLYVAIKNFGSWCHPVDSTWFVDSNLSANTIRDGLTAVMDKTDALVVIKASAPGAWFGLNTEISTWLENHL